MQFDDEARRLAGSRAGLGSRTQSIFLKLLAVCASAVLLISAIVVSLVLFVGVLAAILIFGAYLWWKTRHVRAEIDAARHDAAVIEGEVVGRKEEKDAGRG